MASVMFSWPYILQSFIVIVQNVYMKSEFLAVNAESCRPKLLRNKKKKKINPQFSWKEII